MLGTIETRLRRIESAIERPVSPEAETRRGKRITTLAGRFGTWAAVAASALVAAGLLVGLGLAIQAMRQLQLSDLEMRAAEVDRRLDDTQAQLEAIRRSSAGIDTLVVEVAGVRDGYRQLDADARMLLGEIGSYMGKAEEFNGRLRGHAERLDEKLEGLGSAVAGQVGPYVEKAYVRPVEESRATLDDLVAQVRMLRDSMRQRVGPERVAVVVFDSSRLRAETSRESLRRLFRETPLRGGYRGFEPSLHLASEGRVRETLIPFGEEPVPARPFSSEWTTEEGSVERVASFDPKVIFDGGPDDVPRRVVLVVSPQAEAPAEGDPNWPESLRVDAVIVGEGEPTRLASWEAFCGSQGGGRTLTVPEAGEPLLRSLEALLRPAPLPIAEGS
ncbi:hypothetical protein [Tautonia plasticadhaerens]|uniref:hypothetical protein n=1 Tax=Tautonia plasticadhaerens TaxID=2527974 RepID=UPI0011A26352|nr:hypothetical protein [Tautonia plasticadhaerens]